MMTSLLERISRKLHEIVDRALEARSVALYDQYIRDVEAYRTQVEESAALMYAGIQANKRRLAKAEETELRLGRRADQLSSTGEEESARIARADLEIQRQLVATTRAQIANQESDYRQLLIGRQETRERLGVIRSERPAVESLLALVKAGELVEKIELSLGGLARLGETSDVGRIAAGIQSRFDEAEIRWQLAAADLAAEEAQVESEEAEVESQLAERMRRLGLEESD